MWKMNQAMAVGIAKKPLAAELAPLVANAAVNENASI